MHHYYNYPLSTKSYKVGRNWGHWHYTSISTWRRNFCLETLTLIWSILFSDIQNCLSKTTFVSPEVRTMYHSSNHQPLHEKVLEAPLTSQNTFKDVFLIFIPNCPFSPTIKFFPLMQLLQIIFIRKKMRYLDKHNKYKSHLKWKIAKFHIFWNCWAEIESFYELWDCTE